MSELDALQTTLEAEHAAVFVYGALGGRASSLTSPTLRAALDAAYAVHVERRDQLRAMITDLGSSPDAAEAAYRLPAPLATAAQISAAALAVERGAVTTYAALVAATAGVRRAWAVSALTAGAVGERAFGGVPEALPGISHR